MGARFGPTSSRPFVVQPDEAERFWARVKRGGGCWEWQGPRFRTGARYGMTNVRARHGVPVGAHRVAYVIAHGPVPAGMCVLHECDNPTCCNPAHLSLGTHRRNMQDCASRGRHHNVRKTHCDSGHEFTADNTKRVGRARVCRECQRAFARRANDMATERRDAAFREQAADALAAALPDTLAALSGEIGVRHASVVARFFGLYGLPAVTLNIIGPDMGITRERARQIRNAGLHRLGIDHTQFNYKYPSPKLARLRAA